MMAYPTIGRVWAREPFVIIVASGPSLEDFEFSSLDGLPTIAVNAAIEYVAARYWITVDPNRRNYELMSNPREGTTYFAAVPDGYGDHSKVASHLVDPLPHVTYLRRVQQQPTEDDPTGMILGLADDPSEIHTGNSAYGALGLAYHMEPQRVALLGVDAKGDRYFYDRGRVAKSLEHLPELFPSAWPALGARGIAVVNGSPESAVACFPRMAPEEAVEWALGRYRP